MATIDDLPIKDLASLSDDELLSLIKGVRARRRDTTSDAHKEAKKKAITKKSKGKAVALKSVSELTKGLTKEAAQKLLAELTQANKGD